MIHPDDLPQGLQVQQNPPRPVAGPPRWALSPVDCQAHVLVDGDQPLGVVKAQCGALLPTAVAVHDHPRGRRCPPCVLILRVGDSADLWEKPPSADMEGHNRADRPSTGRRRAIPATCGLHRGSVGFTNLLVSMRDGTIVLDPHVTGSCVISLDEHGATALRDTLTEWLG